MPSNKIRFQAQAEREFYGGDVYDRELEDDSGIELASRNEYGDTTAIRPRSDGSGHVGGSQLE